MSTRLHRFLALILMFSVQFATLGVMPSECEVEGGALHASAATAAHSMDDRSSMVGHAAMSSVTMTSHSPRVSAGGANAPHECSPDRGATESGSHPTHCELAAPCGSLLFTTAGNSPRLAVMVEQHSTLMLERFPAATLPAPDAPPPRA